MLFVSRDAAVAKPNWSVIILSVREKRTKVVPAYNTSNDHPATLAVLVALPFYANTTTTNTVSIPAFVRLLKSHSWWCRAGTE